MSDWSAVSTCPSWTGDEVWPAGITSPLWSLGDDGVPGFTSTKYVPSRNSRERIFSSASRWSGRPLFPIDIVSSAAEVPFEVTSPLTDVTWPT